ncbi:ribonuclease III [Kamptonema cortianum]|nr:ribonuclease III [Geitlerinema splendidum]MDK3157560.1 ribonuclease III [Kamptonema cortianum]
MNGIPKRVPLKDERLFRLAMTHRSATENPVEDSYERLEFYGDAVLSLVVAQYLYEHHPDWDQGIMSKARSSVVQEAPLAERAKNLNLDEHLILGAGEEATGGRTRPSVLCDIFESVIGAIYIESGLEAARWFVLEQLDPYLRRVSTGEINPHDYKSRLQEVAQSLWRKTPIYKVVDECGNAHDRRFTVRVIFDNEAMGEGHGRSKKEAEQAAARDALELIELAQRSKRPNQSEIE